MLFFGLYLFALLGVFTILGTLTFNFGALDGTLKLQTLVFRIICLLVFKSSGMSLRDPKILSLAFFPLA